MQTVTVTIKGWSAIEHAEKHDLTLGKYGDPIEGPREGLTVDEAREVAHEDPTLIYVEVEQAAPANLDELLTALREGRMELDTDLPVFGGAEPESTSGVWSWDETRLLVGAGSDELQIVSRSQTEGLTASRKHGVMTVADESGGRWWPSDETAERIDAAADPEAEALRLCLAGAPGEWRN